MSDSLDGELSPSGRSVSTSRAILQEQCGSYTELIDLARTEANPSSTGYLFDARTGQLIATVEYWASRPALRRTASSFRTASASAGTSGWGDCRRWKVYLTDAYAVGREAGTVRWSGRRRE